MNSTPKPSTSDTSSNLQSQEVSKEASFPGAAPSGEAIKSSFRSALKDGDAQGPPSDDGDDLAQSLAGMTITEKAIAERCDKDFADLKTYFDSPGFKEMTQDVDQTEVAKLDDELSKKTEPETPLKASL
ncbi:hypothetical protein BC938DRAFT_482313 [Jimgerdemannia flammicorona]|uniref:Uncharacterized protein n=1 Tax=Jimgerdemannia flammicorona TaxID=994334 RepID=A0A433QE79_9FUNG|nr:hypothetical protein BC938DRAFT_482313 [Jimgerdemannia flammicorona]